MYKIFLLSLLLGTQQDRLERYLQIQHERLGFSGVLTAYQNGQPLYRVKTGQASRELNVPLTFDARFRVASISKQFTALLTVLAMEEKKLRPADSLALFFPTLQHAQWRRITVEQLLSHTSGIPHNEGIADYWTIKSRLPLTKEQALREIFQMKLRPDTLYSSPGYFLLACILEKTYGKDYPALLQEKVLQPLHMQHTGVFTHTQIIPSLVSGYHLLRDSLIPAPYRDPSLMKGSGDLYSTAEDLQIWNNSLLNDGQWSTNIRQQLFTVHNRALSYGYGWYLRPEQGKYWHGGGTFGCSAISAVYEKEKLSIVLLGNVSVLPVNEMLADIEKIVSGQPFDMPAPHPPVIHLGDEQLKAFTGIYVAEGQELRILQQGHQLYAKMGNHPPFEIYPASEREFYGRKVNVRLIFKDGGLEAALRGQIHRFSKR
ncbi:serine hydrolase domain-containing protein [Chitinophaga cymbidii]|uniref:Serine hydrolase n=1 Tax=Chitinophaga cymbidii TaxID=1096750 RepID=A0A512RN51_9BACT|nr:serine hydrolase domain-containing protein [Chitinophaga cymbidii]GEP97130.1 serine hydrolase [Chitinophaga cymbidii]